MSNQNTKSIREDDLRVDSSGRVHVGKHVVRSIGAERGDLMQCVLHADGEEKHFVDTLGSQNRVGIPARFREEYGIEAGDTVDIEVKLP